MWTVYILLCGDNSLYTGMTNNLQKRFLEHKSGKGGKYTRSHLPIKIVYSEEYPTKSESLKRELQIKGLSRVDKLKLVSEPQSVLK